MKNYEIDEVPDVRDVVLSGEFFTMLVSVALIEGFRETGETDDEFAVRLAGLLVLETYGWDVASVTLEAGVVEG